MSDSSLLLYFYYQFAVIFYSILLLFYYFTTILLLFYSFPTSIYLRKHSDINGGKIWERCSTYTIKSPKWRQRHFVFCINKFEYILHFFTLVFYCLLLKKWLLICHTVQNLWWKGWFRKELEPKIKRLKFECAEAATYLPIFLFTLCKL